MKEALNKPIEFKPIDNIRKLIRRKLYPDYCGESIKEPEDREHLADFLSNLL